MGYSPWGHTESNMTEQHTYTQDVIGVPNLNMLMNQLPPVNVVILKMVMIELKKNKPVVYAFGQ